MASLRMVVKPVRVFGCNVPFHSALNTTLSPVTLLQKTLPRQPQWRRQQYFFCSTSTPSSDVCVQYRHDRVVLEVTLPSRQERCQFFLRPVVMTAGELLSELQREDPGVTARLLTKDGEKVSSSTLMETLLRQDFQLLINGAVHLVQPPPPPGAVCSERVLGCEDMKHLVHRLHSALHLSEHQQLQERNLLERLDQLQQKLCPLEEMKVQIAGRAESQASRALWGGLALLSVQGGALAWLTWWVYSWDVMEPVTYFLTYATSMAVFSYFVLTKQDYVYPDAKDRKFLHYFYRGAKRHGFDVERYNQLTEQLVRVKDDLRRLRNPTQLQLPVEQLQTKP
ncbi:calcium uniporter regulatory subunit MCUb, mitochondrial-like [Hypomesus transpacificus]|uniref:calcium uniporter regulatory subunit MCUb, mitochondrial-like n=1 Tax=Hypomesus transpacificus TaxID=137520 RepID=UPI001F073721|nr:calcium uniporter regulatory subunit MCUb, mitochondrial-like [Hypomesus transpacificus]